MRVSLYSWTKARPVILPLVASVLAGLIFVVDTVTDLEIAVAVFYVAVVLLSVTFCQTRGVLLVSLGCVALTVLSYAFTRTGSAQPGLINGVISILAIAATTYLVLKIDSATVAVHEARAQLAHIARVTTLGELTASIAHEVNQPLTGIITSSNACVRWLAAEPPNVEKAKQAVGRILRDATRASEVVLRVRSLAKKAPSCPEPINIKEAILEVLTLMQADIDRNSITLQTHFSDDLPPIVGDRIQLQQAILNLTLNAMEALALVRDGPRELSVRTEKHSPAAILIVVSDTGVGVEQGNQNDVFDAFYTTKRDGMGLGLTITRAIVEAHRGRLWVTPNTPRGAAFQFVISGVDRVAT